MSAVVDCIKGWKNGSSYPVVRFANYAEYDLNSDSYPGIQKHASPPRMIVSRLIVVVRGQNHIHLPS